jgi:hypothetical protein
MILRDRRSTSYDLASLFRGKRSTLDGMEKSQNALVRGCHHSTQLFIFEVSLAELFSQNCFVFDVDNFKHGAPSFVAA